LGRRSLDEGLVARLSRPSEGNLEPLMYEKKIPGGPERRTGRGCRGGAGEVLLDAIRLSTPYFVALG